MHILRSVFEEEVELYVGSSNKAPSVSIILQSENSYLDLLVGYLVKYRHHRSLG